MSAAQRVVDVALTVPVLSERPVLTLAPARCSGCSVRSYTRAQVRRWPHLGRYPVVDLVNGRCPACAEALRVELAAQQAAAEAAAAAAAAEEAARAERARQARVAAWATRRAKEDAAREQARRSAPPPTNEQRRAWTAEDHRGRRGLRRTVVRGVVRWVE